jgi:hypothetical protein
MTNTELNYFLSDSELTVTQVLGRIPDSKQIRVCKQGLCDTCGVWDSSLIEGLCHVCDLKYGGQL